MGYVINFLLYFITCMYCTVVVVIVLQHFLQKTLPRLPFVHPLLRRPRRVHLLDDHYQYPRAPNFPPPTIKTKTKRMTRRRRRRRHPHPHRRHRRRRRRRRRL